MKVDVKRIRFTVLAFFSRLRCFSTTNLPQEIHHLYLKTCIIEESVKSGAAKMDSQNITPTSDSETREPESETKTESKRAPLGAFILTSAPVLLGKLGDGDQLKTKNPRSIDKRHGVDSTPVNTTVSNYDSGIMMKLITTGPPRTSKPRVLPRNLLDKVTDTVREQYVNSNVLVNTTLISSNNANGDNSSSKTEGIYNVNTYVAEKYVERNMEVPDDIQTILESDKEVLSPENKDKSSDGDITDCTYQRDLQISQLQSQDSKIEKYDGIYSSEQNEMSTCILQTNNTEIRNSIQKHSINNVGIHGQGIKKEQDKSHKLCKGQEKSHKLQQEQEKDKKQRTEDEIYNIADLFNGNFDNKYKKWRKRRDKQAKNRVKVTEDLTSKQGTIKEERKKKKRPTHFIAIQVDNSEVQRKAKIVQDCIVSQQKDLLSVMICPAKFHFTLLVMCLENEENVERAQSALDVFQRKYAEMFKGKPFFLDIHGVDHFRSSVVFTSVHDEAQLHHLKTVASDLLDCFSDHGIALIDEKRDFKPHLTLAKMSKDSSGKLRKKGIKKIDGELYKEHKDIYFGRQFVTHLQLCDMFRTKNKSGYYNIQHAVQIVNEDCYVGVPTSAQLNEIHMTEDESTIRKLGKEIVENSIQSAIRELQLLSQQESAKEAGSEDSETRCECSQTKVIDKPGANENSDTKHDCIQAKVVDETGANENSDTKQDCVQAKVMDKPGATENSDAKHYSPQAEEKESVNSLERQTSLGDSGFLDKSDVLDNSVTDSEKGE